MSRVSDNSSSSESESDGEEYEVEKIVDAKVRKYGIMYNVKWAGYPDSENTWEPARNLENAQEKIAEYWEQHEERVKTVQKKFGRKTGAAMIHYPKRDNSVNRRRLVQDDSEEEFVPQKDDGKHRREERLPENVWRDEYRNERVPANAVPAEMIPQLAALLPPSPYVPEPAPALLPPPVEAIPVPAPAQVPVKTPRAKRDGEAPRVARMLPIPMTTRVQVWTIIERPLPIPDIIETRPAEEPFMNGFEEDDFSAGIFEDAFEFEVDSHACGVLGHNGIGNFLGAPPVLLAF